MEREEALRAYLLAKKHQRGADPVVAAVDADPEVESEYESGDDDDDSGYGDDDGDGDGDGDGDDDEDGDEDDGDGDDALDTIGPLRGQDDDDVAIDDKDDDDVVVVRDDNAVEKAPEDENEFETLLAAMMQESAESRKLVTRVSADNMAIPMHAIKAQASRAQSQQVAALVTGSGLGAGASDAPLGGKVFTVLRRRAKGAGAGKVETRSLVVPEDVPLARFSAKAAVRGG